MRWPLVTLGFSPSFLAVVANAAPLETRQATDTAPDDVLPTNAAPALSTDTLNVTNPWQFSVDLVLNATGGVQCFNDAFAPVAQPPANADCVTALDYMLKDSNFAIPGTFSNWDCPLLSRQVPMNWNYFSCSITLNASLPNVTDSFTIQSVYLTTIDILRQCVGGDDYGGMEAYGIQGFWITVSNAVDATAAARRSIPALPGAELDESPIKSRDALGQLPHPLPLTGPKPLLAENTNYSLSDPGELDCNEPPDQTIHVSLSSCDAALQRLSTEAQRYGGAPQSFGHTSGYIVPRRWYSDLSLFPCTIVLSSVKDTETDTFTLDEVLDKAKYVLTHCTQYELGGILGVGNGRGFYVGVAGRTPIRLIGDNAGIESVQ